MNLYHFSISSIDAEGISHLIVEDNDQTLDDTVATIRTILDEASGPDAECVTAAFDLTIEKSFEAKS